MHPVVAVTFEGIKVTELAIGSALGIALGVVAGLVPRLRKVAPPGAAVVGVLVLAGFDVADRWVVAAVVVPAATSVLVTQLRGAPVAITASVTAAAALVGAGLLMPAAASMVDVPRPTVVGAFAAVAALTSLAADRHLTPTSILAMGAWTAFGLFLCNPDTEGSSLVGSLLAASATVATVLMVTWSRSRPEPRAAEASGSTRIAGTAVPLVLVLVWVGVHGADAREDTIIGGYACLGVLLVLPLAVGLSLLVPDRDHRRGVLPGRLLTAVQAPLVVVCARIAGIRTTAERAVLVSGACLAVATAILALALGHRPRSDERPRRAPVDR